MYANYGTTMFYETWDILEECWRVKTILNTLLIIKSTKVYIVQIGDVRFSVNICAPVYLYISQMQTYVN